MRFVFALLFLSNALFASEMVHDHVLSEVADIYGPHAKSLNRSFQILVVDSLAEVASADSDGFNYKIIHHKGLVDNPKIDEDVIRLVSCHEIGHTHGGSPRRAVPEEWEGPIAHDGLSFISTEGQSDYYATAVCFRELIKSQERKKAINVNPEIVSICNSVWKKNSNDSYACQRAIVAAENFLQMHIKIDISVRTPDTSIADKRTRDTYPSRQCRFDTFVKGALCKSHKDLLFDFNNSSANECENPEGRRPLCWFKE